MLSNPRSVNGLVVPGGDGEHPLGEKTTTEGPETGRGNCDGLPGIQMGNMSQIACSGTHQDVGLVLKRRNAPTSRNADITTRLRQSLGKTMLQTGLQVLQTAKN